MFEEKKKGNKGLIFLFVFLIIIILGLVAYICYDKGMFDSFLGKEEPKVEENAKVEKLSEEKVMELHDSLITEGRGAGLYFSKDVTINDIDSKYLMPYVILSYVKDNNIINITADPNNTTVVTKDEVDDYIKTNFNTDKVFSLKYDKNGFNAIYTYWKYRMTLCYYDKDSYTLSNAGHSNGIDQYYNKFLKSEQDGDNLYIYDKVFVFSTGDGYSEVISGNDIILEYDLWTKKFNSKDTKWFNSKINAANEDYIFDNYSDKLDTYKTTFKKADDGKYYWYSSEIVHEW